MHACMGRLGVDAWMNECLNAWIDVRKLLEKQNEVMERSSRLRSTT